jgi:uncharacterized protein DUF4136
MLKTEKFARPLMASLFAAKMVALIVLFLMAAGCATQPEVRIDKAPAANLSAYRTFSFYDRLSTDRPNYSSIMSARLKQATRDELERHGYVYNEHNPDLKVNFALRVADRQEVRSYPGNGGVFIRRAGLTNVDVIQYRQGTVSIDLVDNRQKSLIWQGIADGRIDDKISQDPGKAIDLAVRQIFIGFPLSRK